MMVVGEGRGGGGGGGGGRVRGVGDWLRKRCQVCRCSISKYTCAPYMELNQIYPLFKMVDTNLKLISQLKFIPAAS